jgi:hypothetical protein
MTRKDGRQVKGGDTSVVGQEGGGVGSTGRGGGGVSSSARADGEREFRLTTPAFATAPFSSADQLACASHVAPSALTPSVSDISLSTPQIPLFAPSFPIAASPLNAPSTRPAGAGSSVDLRSVLVRRGMSDSYTLPNSAVRTARTSAAWARMVEAVGPDGVGGEEASG